MWGDFPDLLRRLSLDVTDLANRLRSVFESPIVQGEVVTGTMLAGNTTVVLRHSLGRPAVGAVVVASSAAGAFTVDPSTDSLTITVRTTAVVGADVDLTLWCF